MTPSPEGEIELMTPSPEGEITWMTRAAILAIARSIL
jgi:hypothetical protein